MWFASHDDMQRCYHEVNSAFVLFSWLVSGRNSADVEVLEDALDFINWRVMGFIDETSKFGQVPNQALVYRVINAGGRE